MEIISNCTNDIIERAAKALIEGHLVAFPTETVYGLGADATNEKAVSRIYAVKGRPTGHPLIVHIASINQLDKWALDIPEYAIKLAREFWPGPMTLILKRDSLAKNFITGGQENVGLRIPNQSTALALLSEFQRLGGFGIAAPSANRFGAVSPTNAEAVADELSKFLGVEDLILDDGDCVVGVESTIIDCTKEFPMVMRPGAITTEMIEIITGLKVQLGFKKSEIRAPGLLESHYSPKAQVVIGNHTESGNGFIALANLPTPTGAIRLASPKDIQEYAKVFYMALREGDKKGLKNITVAQPSGVGLAVAIRDRINKAASVNDL
jgi:L-threonylcarbamoyladenylate synthase